MVKPISYLQTDPRWKNHNYSAPGEKKTIGSSGCGPTSAAMVIATLKDKNVTPVTTSEWSMKNGYKAYNQGTYYTYFVPQMEKYGITCRRLNTANLYGKNSSAAHTEALNALQRDDWVIACMGKGNWTSSGHFILLYGFENGYVSINDPASTASRRIKNTWALFSKQVKYMWTVTVPDRFKTSAAETNKIIKSGQQYANQFAQCGLVTDGIYGSSTKRGGIKVLQHALNLDYGKTISEDGIWGAKSNAKLGSHYVKRGEKQYLVTALEILLMLQGYDPHGVEFPGIFGGGLEAVLKQYQKCSGLSPTGIADAGAFRSLIS